MVQVPWAGARSRWTLQFEARALKVLQGSESVQAACRLLRLNWESAHILMQRAVDRGLQRRSLDDLEFIGIDEKSFGRGQDFGTLCNDLKRCRVLEVIRGRTSESVCEALGCMTTEQAKKVKAACLDMSAAFEKALVLTLPWALRVYDRFHISKLLGEAVDIVTRARQFFNIWYRLAVRSKLAPIVKVAKTLKTHLEGLLNLLNYFRHRITNAMSAGINSAVQKIKATARSFRNFDNFRTRILFFFGQLDLHPTTR